MIGVGNDRQWAQLCRAMDRPELAEDPRYDTIPGRVARRDEVNGLVTAWMAAQPDRDVALARLQAERVPAAPVLSVAEAARHPHVRHRRTVRTVDDDVMGPLDVPGMPLRFSAFPDAARAAGGVARRPQPRGRVRLLGWYEDRYQALVDGGVLRHATDQLNRHLRAQRPSGSRQPELDGRRQVLGQGLQVPEVARDDSASVAEGRQHDVRIDDVRHRRAGQEPPDLVRVAARRTPRRRIRRGTGAVGPAAANGSPARSTGAVVNGTIPASSRARCSAHIRR